MAYDQGSIDLRLNETEAGPYAPVADKRWVEKVIKLVLKTISKNKLSIGVATYGYEYEAVRLAEDGFKYDMLWNFNPKYALDLAQQLNITPERNSAGELNFAYSTISSSTPTMATSTPFNILWWSDALAIKDKVALAKKLGVRGISIFKIDGGADPLLWDILK
jgi:spore germination protein YaaH